MSKKAKHTVLKLERVSHTYASRLTVPVLENVSVSLKRGEVVALVAPSGQGKSTLLHIAGLMETPFRGEVEIDGVKTRRISEREKTRLRREKIGFVFQRHFLMDEFSILDNVALARRLAGQATGEARAEAEKTLAAVGLASRLSHRPSELSGGEQQRASLARALMGAPAVLLADEPTGNLDHKNASHVFDLLIRQAKEAQIAALVATHNEALARRAGRILTIDTSRKIKTIS